MTSRPYAKWRVAHHIARNGGRKEMLIYTAQKQYLVTFAKR